MFLTISAFVKLLEMSPLHFFFLRKPDLNVPSKMSDEKGGGKMKSCHLLCEISKTVVFIIPKRSVDF